MSLMAKKTNNILGCVRKNVSVTLKDITLQLLIIGDADVVLSSGLPSMTENFTERVQQGTLKVIKGLEYPLFEERL